MTDKVLSASDEMERFSPVPEKEVDNDPPTQANENDLEAGKVPAFPDLSVDDSEVNKDEDPNLVTWSGPDDPENPKNWPNGQKWKNTWAISMFVFISPISSAMIAPAMQDLGKRLDMHSQLEVYLSLAIFILAYAVGPIFFGPASELYGRVRLLQVSNVWYLVWRDFLQDS